MDHFELNVLQVHLSAVDCHDLVNRQTRSELSFDSFKRALLDTAAVEQVLHPAAQQLRRVQQELFAPVHLIELALQPLFVELLKEEDDVGDGCHHLEGQSGLQRLQRLDLVTGSQKALPVRHVAQHHEQCLLPFEGEGLLRDRELPQRLAALQIVLVLPEIKDMVFEGFVGVPQ